MYCISCGKTIPDDASFCAYCGKSQKGEENKPVEWEFTDFVFPYGNRVGAKRKAEWFKGYSDNAARAESWAAHQQQILPELQVMLDQGWQPLSEVGPSAIRLESVRKFDGILYGGFNTYLYPVEFRVKLRRRKA